MLVQDLTISGCVESVYLLPRSDFPRILANSTGDAMRTNGRLTIVYLRDCDRPAVAYGPSAPISIHPRSRMVRYFRNRVLLYKSDVIRGNTIYGMFDLFRMSARSFRNRYPSPVDDDKLPFSPTSPEALLPQIPVEPLDLSHR